MKILSNGILIFPLLFSCTPAIVGEIPNISNSDSSASFGADKTPPTVGTPITVTHNTPMGALVSWGSAKDDSTSAIQYKLVRGSSASSIDSVEEVDAIAGTNLIMDWAADRTSYFVFSYKGESPFFSVLAKDGAGNKSVYSPVQSSTTTGSTMGTVVSKNDGSAVVLYRDDSDSAKLKAFKLSSSFTLDFAPTTLDSAGVFGLAGWNPIHAIYHSNGTYVASYTSSTNSYGRFLAFNSSGTVTTAPTQHYANLVWFTSVAEIGSGSNNVVLPIGQNHGSQNGIAYLQNSTSTGAPTSNDTFHAAIEVRNATTCTFGNGSVAVLYSVDWNNVYARLSIYNSSFTKVLDAQVLTGGNVPVNTGDFGCTQLANGNILAVYGDGLVGRYIIFNSTGVTVAGPTTFDANNTTSPRAVRFSATKTMILYRASDSSGRYVIYDSTGGTLSSPVTFASQAAVITATPFGSSSVLVNFQNVIADTASRTLKVITP